MGRRATAYRNSSSWERQQGIYRNRSQLTPEQPYDGPTGASILSEAHEVGGAPLALMCAMVPLVAMGSIWLVKKLLSKGE